MKFTLKDQEYRIRFRHTRYDDGTATTECELLKGCAVAWGTARCSERDQFSRAEGRRIALERTMKRLREKGLGTLATTTQLAYDRRKWLAEGQAKRKAEAT